MMSASDTAAHLNYLTDAAHLLAFTAPETSSYLMTQRNGLMFANELEQSATQRQHVCSACGRIMIPGHNSTLKLENPRALRIKAKRDTSGISKTPNVTKSDTQSGPSKVFTCETCDRYTRITLPAPSPISRRKMLPTAAVSATTRTAKQLPSANASSKKRAKNRKAGLQALLAQAQAGSSSSSGAGSGLGLSLSDFMKR